MKKRLWVVGVILTSVCIQAQQEQNDSTKIESLKEVIITATKFPTEKKNLGKLVYKITSKMIDANPGKSVVDFLNEVPGIEINGNYSTKGQNLGYYIRGGRNRQVAILIDGVAVTDPSSFSGDFDLRQIPINQIAYIEVMKGAASTLYGTGAATGVINIVLKKSGAKPIQGSFTTYIGTNNSQEKQNSNVADLASNFNFNGALNGFHYLLSFNAMRSNGLSAAESPDENKPFNEDAFNRFNTLLKLGFNVSDGLAINLFANYDEFTTEYDGFDFVSNGYIDAGNSLKSIQKRIGLAPSYTYKKGALKLRAFYTKIDKNVAPSEDQFEGEAIGFDLYNNYKINDSFGLLTGLSAQFQDMFQKTGFSSIESGSANQHFIDPYLAINYKRAKGLNLNTGVRLNAHNEYGQHLVYNINPSYNFSVSETSNVKLMASYSTAFVTPTLQEIFNKLPSIDALNPEKDKTIEGGFEWQISKKITINSVYFYREETDKIGFDFSTFQTINDIGTFNAKGIESELHYKASEKLNLVALYAHINRDESLLLKIPKHKFAIHANYQASNKTYFSFKGQFVDATSDFGGVALPSYRLLDFFANHKLISNRLTLFYSITNLLNEDYQELAGFSTRGRNYKVGLKLDF